MANTTHPDLYLAGRVVPRHNHNPLVAEWTTVVKTLLFVASTTELGLTYRRRSDNSLLVYVDASFMSRDNERKNSLSGGAMSHEDMIVSWFSPSQRNVALSLT